MSPDLLPPVQVARFQQEAAGLARARAEKESELRRLREENEKYVGEQEEKETKFQVCLKELSALHTVSSKFRHPRLRTNFLPNGENFHSNKPTTTTNKFDNI